MLNGIVKAKYGFDLKGYPRVTAQIKAFDVNIKKKAAIFSKDDLDSFIGDVNFSTPYWIVRKAVAICCYFGGLRKSEAETLDLEKITFGRSGITITHSRSKQRSDIQETKLLIPRRQTGICYASVFDEYLHSVKEILGQRTGRVWMTGRSGAFVKTPMGKNILGKIPHEIAEYLKLESPKNYTFHSFRR